jgi:hypothetical protein
MSRRIIHYEFPEGVATVFIDGKRYNRAEFEKAKALEIRRGKKGRFTKVTI